MDLARFTGTTAYVGRVRHPEHGLIHVLGYQNIATNLATGPNAMLLHLPATPAPQCPTRQPCEPRFAIDHVDLLAQRYDRILRIS